jgi:predicted RNA-binding protein associated with RNAse of E/G family
MWPDRYYSVDPMWDDATGELHCWYVNFQTPYLRGAIGADTSDLHLDLVVTPDLSYRWKDEDEYAQARRLGLVTDGCHRRIEQAREQVVGLVERRQGPFGQPWPSWRRDPAWPLPQLPDDALDLAGPPELAGLPA